MADHEEPKEGRVAESSCPVCGDLYARSGLPNHIRRHVKLAAESSTVNHINRKPLAWWEAWAESYKVGINDGRMQHRKEKSPSTRKSGN